MIHQEGHFSLKRTPLAEPDLPRHHQRRPRVDPDTELDGRRCSIKIHFGDRVPDTAS